jgi:hypothetical protein
MPYGDNVFGFSRGLLVDETSPGVWQVVQQTNPGYANETGLVTTASCERFEPVSAPRIGYSPVGSGESVAWSWTVEGAESCGIQRFPGDDYAIAGTSPLPLTTVLAAR